MPSSACDWSSDVCSRSEEHTSELQSHSEISYPVFCLKKKKKNTGTHLQPCRLRPGNDLDNRTIPFHIDVLIFCFFFNDTATTEIYTNLNTLSLHDALPI